MNKGTDKENSNNLLSMIERSLKEAPLDDRNAERITLVSITILYFFTRCVGHAAVLPLSFQESTLVVCSIALLNLLDASYPAFT